MEVKILKQEKNELEAETNSVTIAEILRVYLNKQGIEFAAWRREQPSKPALIKVKSSGKTVKKEVSDAISAIKKDLNKIISSVKK